jgi:hypothetical protein
VTNKLITTINKLIDADLRCGRVVSVEDTALRAVHRARCQGELELAQALVGQALIERLGHGAKALDQYERAIVALGEARAYAQALALLADAKGASYPVLATIYTVGVVFGALPDESCGHPALATLHKVGDRVLFRWVYTGDALPDGCLENRWSWENLFRMCQADAAELARLNQWR